MKKIGNHNQNNHLNHQFSSIQNNINNQLLKI